MNSGIFFCKVQRIILCYNVDLQVAYPKVVEGRIRNALSRDVLGDLVEHVGVLLRVHDGSGDELSMRPDREVPRLYPHQVVERKLQD